ncbi:MAG: DegV family protein [Anaerolineae bacterium]
MTFKNIRLITDSTCDIPDELVKKYNIGVVPAFVNYGGMSYADDGHELDRHAYYAQIPTMTSQPTTAAPSPGLVEQIINTIFAESDHIVMITAPAALSSIYNSFRLGAINLPQDRITLIDSGTVSMGLGFQVLVGAEIATETGDIDAVISAIQRAREHVKVYAVPETMEYLRRSGRVGWAAAGAAALLQIKPIVKAADGVVESVARVRTFGKAIEKLVELAQNEASFDQLALVHANNPEGAEDIKQRLGTLIPERTYIINVTPVIGTHIGPKSLGVITLNQGWRQ